MNEYNLYDISKCKRAIQALKAFPVTCRFKGQHPSKLCVLTDLVSEYCSSLNPFLFDENCFGLGHYRQVVTMKYSETTKVQLDTDLRFALNAIIHEIHSCIDTEYKTQDGRMAPHPTQPGYWIEA